MNSPTLYGQIQSFKCDSFYMGGLDSSTLHYLAVRKAIVSLYRPVHSKITLTTRLPAKLTVFTPENGSQGAIKRGGGPFLGFAKVFSALIVRKTSKTGSY